MKIIVSVNYATEKFSPNRNSHFFQSENVLYLFFMNAFEEESIKSRSGITLSYAKKSEENKKEN